MRRFTVLAAVVVAALAVVGAAQAGNPDGLGPWADYVVAHNQGCAIQPPDLATCVSVPPSRTDPQAAVGPAESPAGPNQNIPVGSFYSIGFTDQTVGTAFITLGFDNAVCNQPGNDLAIDVFEITQEPYPNETVNVFVSKDNVTYVFAGTVTKDGSVPLPAGFGFANFVKLVDATPRGPFGATTIVADGFDLDGVRSLSTIPCDTGMGKIEICKASTNGMTGKLFQYSVNGGAPISVRGGRCSGPITTPAGAVRIVELQSDPATEVTKVTTRPANRLVLTDLPNRTAIVYVVPGSTAANETLVTFTNQPAGGNYGTLKVCKLTETPAFLGRSFQLRGQRRPARVDGGQRRVRRPVQLQRAASWARSRSARVVNVHEQIPAGVEVQWIDTDPGENLLDFNTATGDRHVLIGAGTTIVYYDNEPVPPPATAGSRSARTQPCPLGCDGDSGRPRRHRAVHFTVTDAAGGDRTTLTVLRGPVLRADPGRRRRRPRSTEHAAGRTPAGRRRHAFPGDRLLTVNLINRTATVEVPVSDSANDETQVHFVNEALRGQLKVCKALGPGSADLIGQTFSFNVSSSTGQRDR